MLGNIRYHLNEEEKEKFKQVLKRDRISSLIFTIVWCGFISVGLAMGLTQGDMDFRIPSIPAIQEGSFEDTMSLIILIVIGIFGLCELWLIKDTISKFKSINNYNFICGTIIDKSSQRVNDSRSYYANIQIDTGDILQDIRISRDIYHATERNVILATKKTRNVKKIKVKYVFFR